MTPIAGKLARVQTVVSATTVNHEFSDWMLGLEADIIDVDGFEKTASAGNYWKEGLAGLCGGDATVRGKWDTNKRPTTPFTPGTTPTTFTLGLNLSTVAFVLPCIFRRIGAATDVRQAATFECSVFVNGAPTYPSA